MKKSIKNYDLKAVQNNTFENSKTEQLEKSAFSLAFKNPKNQKTLLSLPSKNLTLPSFKKRNNRYPAAKRRCCKTPATKDSRCESPSVRVLQQRSVKRINRKMGSSCA
ncbi:hypothetical protein EOK75_03950 [Pseudorhodobacter turbinis]|uniref:Uncharacterized protein n=1 Tax=Pseudorhodobacter turbinis TaxID=2500533 RepID=A0A4P8EE33_9RHOB|nr:hypothetical protein EOK75_03950 [Pseudorhodobacter turbinis]